LVELDPQLAVLAAVTTAIGWTMLFAGARKRMLDLRHEKRICPSCGHEIEGRVCNRH
jgi:rRNA maturation endonuclease Nob1